MQHPRLIIAALAAATLASWGCDKNVNADSQPPEGAQSPDTAVKVAQTDAPEAEGGAIAGAEEPPSLPPCEPVPENVKQLLSYKKVDVPGGKYWLILERPEGNLWLPAEHIPDKERHETTLELNNAGDLPELVEHTGTKVRASIETVNNTTDIDDSSRKWFYYHRLSARITSVCVPQDDG